MVCIILRVLDISRFRAKPLAPDPLHIVCLVFQVKPLDLGPMFIVCLVCRVKPLALGPVYIVIFVGLELNLSIKEWIL